MIGNNNLHALKTVTIVKFIELGVFECSGLKLGKWFSMEKNVELQQSPGSSSFLTLLGWVCLIQG